MLRAMNEEEQAGRNRPRPLFLSQKLQPRRFPKGHVAARREGEGEEERETLRKRRVLDVPSLSWLIETYLSHLSHLFPGKCKSYDACHLIFRVSSLK